MEGVQPISTVQPIRTGQSISTGHTVRTGQTVSTGQSISNGQPISTGQPISNGQPISTGPHVIQYTNKLHIANNIINILNYLLNYNVKFGFTNKNNIYEYNSYINEDTKAKFDYLEILNKNKKDILIFDFDFFNDTLYTDVSENINKYKYTINDINYEKNNIEPIHQIYKLDEQIIQNQTLKNQIQKKLDNKKITRYQSTQQQGLKYEIIHYNKFKLISEPHLNFYDKDDIYLFSIKLYIKNLTFELNIEEIFFYTLNKYLKQNILLFLMCDYINNDNYNIIKTLKHNSILNYLIFNNIFLINTDSFLSDNLTNIKGFINNILYDNQNINEISINYINEKNTNKKYINQLISKPVIEPNRSRSSVISSQDQFEELEKKYIQIQKLQKQELQMQKIQQMDTLTNKEIITLINRLFDIELPEDIHINTIKNINLFGKLKKYNLIIKKIENNKLNLLVSNINNFYIKNKYNKSKIINSPKLFLILFDKTINNLITIEIEENTNTDLITTKLDEYKKCDYGNNLNNLYKFIALYMEFIKNVENLIQTDKKIFNLDINTNNVLIELSENQVDAQSTGSTVLEHGSMSGSSIDYCNIIKYKNIEFKIFNFELVYNETENQNKTYLLLSSLINNKSQNMLIKELIHENRLNYYVYFLLIYNLLNVIQPFITKIQSINRLKNLQDLIFNYKTIYIIKLLQKYNIKSDIIINNIYKNNDINTKLYDLIKSDTDIKKNIFNKEEDTRFNIENNYNLINAFKPINLLFFKYNILFLLNNNFEIYYISNYKKFALLKESINNTYEKHKFIYDICNSLDINNIIEPIYNINIENKEYIIMKLGLLDLKSFHNIYELSNSIGIAGIEIRDKIAYMNSDSSENIKYYINYKPHIEQIFNLIIENFTVLIKTMKQLHDFNIYLYDCKLENIVFDIINNSANTIKPLEIKLSFNDFNFTILNIKNDSYNYNYNSLLLSKRRENYTSFIQSFYNYLNVSSEDYNKYINILIKIFKLYYNKQINEIHEKYKYKSIEFILDELKKNNKYINIKNIIDKNHLINIIVDDFIMKQLIIFNDYYSIIITLIYFKYVSINKMNDKFNNNSLFDFNNLLIITYIDEIKATIEQIYEPFYKIFTKIIDLSKENIRLIREYLKRKQFAINLNKLIETKEHTILKAKKNIKDIINYLLSINPMMMQQSIMNIPDNNNIKFEFDKRMMETDQ